MTTDKSLEKALRRIISILREQEGNQFTIQRKYLHETFSSDLLELSINDGLPTLKPFVLEYFKMKGIIISFSIKEMQLNIMSEGRRHLEVEDNLLKLRDARIPR